MDPLKRLAEQIWIDHDLQKLGVCLKPISATVFCIVALIFFFFGRIKYSFFPFSCYYPFFLVYLHTYTIAQFTLHSQSIIFSLLILQCMFLFACFYPAITVIIFFIVILYIRTHKNILYIIVTNGNAFVDIVHIPPALLRYNWQKKVYIFKVYDVVIWYIYTLWNDSHIPANEHSHHLVIFFFFLL